jgi:hypothetical protein
MLLGQKDPLQFISLYENDMLLPTWYHIRIDEFKCNKIKSQTLKITHCGLFGRLASHEPMVTRNLEYCGQVGYIM